MEITNYIENNYGEKGRIDYDLVCDCTQKIHVISTGYNSFLTCDCGRKYVYRTGKYTGRNGILTRLYDRLPIQIYNFFMLLHRR